MKKRKTRMGLVAYSSLATLVLWHMADGALVSLALWRMARSLRSLYGISLTRYARSMADSSLVSLALWLIAWADGKNFLQ